MPWHKETNGGANRGKWGTCPCCHKVFSCKRSRVSSLAERYFSSPFFRERERCKRSSLATFVETTILTHFGKSIHQSWPWSHFSYRIRACNECFIQKLPGLYNADGLSRSCQEKALIPKPILVYFFRLTFRIQISIRYGGKGASTYLASREQLCIWLG